MDSSPTEIRPEAPGDEAAIHAVHLAAFPSPGEAGLVDALRRRAEPYLAWVAESGGEVVGHILFTPVTLPGRDDVKLLGLAPMAVLPGRQNQGIGSALVRAGLAGCRELAPRVRGVVVLGHPEYYPRFGFRPASRFGLGCEYEVPDEVFLAQELVPGGLEGVAGTVRYHEAFAAVG